MWELEESAGPTDKLEGSKAVVPVREWGCKDACAVVSRACRYEIVFRLQSASCTQFEVQCLSLYGVCRVREWPLQPLVLSVLEQLREVMRPKEHLWICPADYGLDCLREAGRRSQYIKHTLVRVRGEALEALDEPG